MSFSSTETFKIPAGKYYVGDPCYLFSSHSTWLELLASNECFNTVEGTVRGGKVWATRTEYGDGCYNSSIGELFPVDAGLIGVVPEELGRECWKEGYPESTEVKPYGVVLVEFKEDFEFKTADDAGTIRVGHIYIYTGDQARDEEVDEEEVDEEGGEE